MSDSMLQAFATAAFNQASPVIGTEAVTISGCTVMQAVLAESATGRSFMEAGFDVNQSLTAVIPSATFAAACPLAAKSYLGNSVSVRGLTLRLTDIRVGASFTTLTLTDPGQST